MPPSLPPPPRRDRIVLLRVVLPLLCVSLASAVLGDQAPPVAGETLSSFIEQLRKPASNELGQKDPPPVADADSVVTTVFPLRYAEAHPLAIQQGGGAPDVTVPGVADTLLGLVFHTPSSGTTRAPGLPNIHAHPTQNAVVVMDLKSHMAFYEQLIHQLDQERPLIEISVAIIDVNSDVNLSWGAEIIAGANGTVSEGTGAIRAGSLSGSDISGLTNALNSSPGVIPTTNLGTSLVEGQQFSIAGMIANSTSRIAGRLRALEGQGKARVLTRPSILTLANMEASFADDARLYVPLLGLNFASVYEIPVTTRIKVIPRIVKATAGGHHQVQLAVLIDDSNTASQIPTGVTTTSSIANVPIVSSNTVTTQAVVSDEGSLLVGGRYRQEQELIDNRAPILGRIPVLGNLFKQKTVGKSRVQRFYLISPRLVLPSEIHIDAQGHTEWPYAKGEVEAAAALANNPLLPPLTRQDLPKGPAAHPQSGQGDLDSATTSPAPAAPQRGLIGRLLHKS